MSVLILPRRFYRSHAPRGRVELVWGNDLVQAINPIGVFCFTEPNGIPRNLVTGNPCTRINNPTIIPHALGFGAYSASCTGGVTSADTWNTGLFPDNTWRSLAGCFTYYSTPSTTSAMICGVHDTTRRFYVAPCTTTSATKIVFGWGSSATDSTPTRSAPALGQTETLAMSAEGWANETSGVTLNRYIDGKYWDQQTGVSWTGTTSTRNFYIGKRTLGATEDKSVEAGPSVFTHWIVIGKNPMSAEVHAELAARPWQMVQKHAERILFFTASAPSGNIAATGGTAAGGSATLLSSGGTSDIAASGGTTAGGSATLSSPSSIAIINTPDRGTIDATNSSVTPNGLTPTINILSRWIYDGANGPRHFFFHVTGVTGLTPVFDISQDLQHAQEIVYTGKFWFSYTGNMGDWTEFANTSDLSSPNVYRVSHSSAFTGDTVYVAMHPPWRVGYTLPWIQSLESSGHISMPASSAGNNYLFETRTATKNGSPGDVGDAIAAQPLYSFKVSNNDSKAPDGNAKRKMVLFSGVHASEDVGNYSLKGAIDFLVSADAKAAQVRAWFDVYVYPLVAAAGRAGGGQRGDFEKLHKDYDANRHWNDTTMETIVKHKTAVALDTGSSIDVFLDFHGDHNRTATFNYFSEIGASNNAAWDAAIKVYYPSIASSESGGSPYIYTSGWAVNTLGGSWVFTPESPYKGTFSLANLELFGADHMRAVADLIDAGEFGTVGGLQASGGGAAGGSAAISSTGGPTGDIAASGGAAAGGAATLSGAATGNLAASGGAQTGGSATLSDSTVGHIAASGGAQAGGSAMVMAITPLTQADFLVTSVRAFQVSQQFGVTNDRFPNKFSEERLVLGFDLGAELAEGETLTAVSATSIIVLQGSDAAPEAVLYGPPRIVGGSIVLQVVQGGLVGVDYKIKHVCTTSNPAKALAITGKIYVE